MFKQFMIVLAVLAILLAARTGYEFNLYMRLESEYSVLKDECSNMSKEDLTWEHKCNHTNPYSEINRMASILLEIMEQHTKFAFYTGYILLFMLISGVFRWIWKGARK